MGVKNNQAAGTDRLQGESFRYGGNGIKKYDGIFKQNVKIEERTPRQIKGIICPLYRKGDKMVCTNFIGVILYIVAY